MSFEKPDHQLSLRETLNLTRQVLDKDVIVFVLPSIIAGIIMGIIKIMLEPLSPASNIDVSSLFSNGFESLISGLLVYLLIQNVFQSLVNSFSYGTCTVAASKSLESENVSIGGSTRGALSRIVPLTIAGIITSEISTIGLTMLIVPGILLIILFSMVQPVMLLEELEVLDSIKRSIRLVRNRIWFTVQIYASVWLITSIVANIVSWIMVSLGLRVGLFGNIVYGIATSLLAPVIPIALTIQYYSLKSLESQSND